MDQQKAQMLLSELQSLENQATSLLEMLKKINESKADLERQVVQLKKENDYLRLKTGDPAAEEFTALANGYEPAVKADRERILLKQKMQSAVQKINDLLDGPAQ